MKPIYYIYQNNELLNQSAQNAQSIYTLNKNCSLIEVTGQSVLLFDRKYNGPVACEDIQEAIYLSTLTKE